MNEKSFGGSFMGLRNRMAMPEKSKRNSEQFKVLEIGYFGKTAFKDLNTEPKA